MTAELIQKYSKYSMPKMLKKCQEAVNAYVRERDKDAGCISCGAKVSQAGHYLSQGHNSAFRFDDERNLFGQCVRCNLFLHGNLINYRKGLVKRIGEEKVLMLEGARKAAHKWDRNTLIFKIEEYKSKLKALKNRKIWTREEDIVI